MYFLIDIVLVFVMVVLVFVRTVSVFYGRFSSCHGRFIFFVIAILDPEQRYDDIAKFIDEHFMKDEPLFTALDLKIEAYTGRLLCHLRENVSIMAVEDKSNEIMGVFLCNVKKQSDKTDLSWRLHFFNMAVSFLVMVDSFFVMSASIFVMTISIFVMSFSFFVMSVSIFVMTDSIYVITDSI